MKLHFLQQNLPTDMGTMWENWTFIGIYKEDLLYISFIFLLRDMKTTLIFAAVFAIVVARPQNFKNAYITRYESDLGRPEKYSFNVETSDGFRHYQSGEVKNAGAQSEALVVTGGYSYIGPDGKTYTVIYDADENGFHPAGDHLPPSAGVKKLGISSAAIASLQG